MGWISALAIYFIIWWTVLFAILPIGFRSQADDGEVVLGTTASAPTQPQIWRKVWMTTAVSTIVFALFYLVTQVYGFGPDDLPHFIPGT
ncbi:DUF1467 family protein [Aurantimonas sp. Leaf443]|uniref:DUF1467 family protein n=1 Tax=Aurantimonas sp. Leaf443 TaxID=1736378 RepID=UPI0006F24B53|nr:DUF1467 family protein [Aurantimonas sp. Leaf443]KQT82740.1 hypothetical protein ASG48_14675 [Aurantimonas sp. Leaf443]